MADEIDYDELDQALRGAIRHEKQHKTPVVKKAEPEKKEAPAPAPKKTPHSVPVKRRSTAPRGHYMDMVSSSSASRRPARPAPARRPVRRPTAKPVGPAPAGVGQLSAPPAAQSVPLVPIAYTQDGTPIVYTQPNMPQVAQPAPAPVQQAPAPAPVVPPQNANLPAEPTPAPAPMPSPTPAPEEAPLGTRSPYMVNTQVDKRPLSNDVKESINQIYGQPSTAQEAEKEAETKKAKKQKSEKKESAFDWKWILTMIVVVIAGAIAGYLFYVLFADKLPF